MDIVLVASDIMEDWVIIGVLCAFFSMIFSVVCAICTQFIRDFRVARLERQVESLTMANHQEKAVEKRNAKSERQAEALAKVAALVQSGKSPMDAIKEVAMSYPDVAMELMKKGI